MQNDQTDDFDADDETTEEFIAPWLKELLDFWNVIDD